MVFCARSFLTVVIFLALVSCSKHQALKSPDCSHLEHRIVNVGIDHLDFDGNIQSGGVLVLDAVAGHVKKIFQDLMSIKFNIHSVIRGDNHDNTKDDHVNDGHVNNSGAFICRSNTSRPWVLSMHAYGLAIDINPANNPFFRITAKDGKIKGSMIPTNALPLYAINRKPFRPNKPYRIGMVDQKVVDIFRKNGFQVWGGDWGEDDSLMVDYMHFQTSETMANLLVAMSSTDAKVFFDENVRFLNRNSREKIQNEDLAVVLEKNYSSTKDMISDYLKNPNQFMIKTMSISNKY